MDDEHGKGCLHCAINRIVEERADAALDANEIINLSDWLDEMILSVADLILYAAPPEQHKNMLTHAIERLEQIVSEENLRAANLRKTPVRCVTITELG